MSSQQIDLKFTVCAEIKGGSYADDDDAILRIDIPTISRKVDYKQKNAECGSINYSIDSILTSPGCQPRMQWDKPVEFLLTIISSAVGLGNIWRFPFTAYDNGGGAFLIPYIIVLMLIGRPLYFMELAMGQFSSYGPVNFWNCVPMFKGIGFGQSIGTFAVVTYYCSIMSISVFYFLSSFQHVLPWTRCNPSWAQENCYDAWSNHSLTEGENHTKLESAAEQYFQYGVLKSYADIDNGIGFPEWRLTGCLLISWIVVGLVSFKGVHSTGKAAYFMAIFPYVVLIMLFIRGVTLPGAGTGLLYFVTPDWKMILTPKVWYSAVTQAFYSLAVGTGEIVMFSSYNRFNHNIYRDAIIISVVDTATSCLAGLTIFAVLGNLAHELNQDVKSVVRTGTGIAFVSYPQAIMKFPIFPQLFAVLFFLMLFTLGLGSTVSEAGVLITIICDRFPYWKRWLVTLAVCGVGFSIGLIYCTPGGQFMVTLVDYFGGAFVVFIFALVECVVLNWIYGTTNFAKDIGFMLNRKISWYWIFSWGIFVPVALGLLLVLFVFEMEPPTYEGVSFPVIAIACGWILFAFTVVQMVIYGVVVILTSKQLTIFEKIKYNITPNLFWGPQNPDIRRRWLAFKSR